MTDKEMLNYLVGYFTGIESMINCEGGTVLFTKEKLNKIIDTILQHLGDKEK